ncbi:type II toxin-antitoxin system VapC family toxin [Cryomorpha ignava]|uniref:Type II toxin-antitoxin system VapC family toxin n=1 Tax=Cryomorpha ignava TaxID=101383 RepID=A0A7K3WNA9_9FLAO|nr:type II toxin-antitoxin system VapC family toxin [Cryomorpha ignava]NEN23137.1 type II toxin-antitoxin system VapC family toxin [Cryomorpha ignava]
MIDTTILIDYFRKSEKANSKLVLHFKHFDYIYISSITQFEILNGAPKAQMQFWDNFLEKFTIISFDSQAAKSAARIVAQLKSKRKTIDKPDLFIPGTAVAHGLTLDTLNMKHFEDIESLKLLNS